MAPGHPKDVVTPLFVSIECQHLMWDIQDIVFTGRNCILRLS